jgi:hypothetical protein
MKLLGNISVGFSVKDCLLIEFSALIRYWKSEYNETALQLFMDFKKSEDSVRMEVLYGILIELVVPWN